MSWRLAESLRVLRNEVNARWPNRDKSSDGTIGDAAHATRNSDHNPYIKDSRGVGVVRAFDIDEDLDGNKADSGADAEWLAEFFRNLGKLRDPRVRYVIYEGRIASSRQDWAWRPYSGPNAHRKHIHLSVVEDPAGYDFTLPWGVYPPRTTQPRENWFDMATKAELREVVDEALADALGPKSKLDVASKVRSIFRHVVEGPDPKVGATRDEMTWPQRVISSLRRIEDQG